MFSLCFPLATVLAASHKFWYASFSFQLSSNCFLIFLEISSLTLGYYRNMLFKFQVFKYFPIIFVWFLDWFNCHRSYFIWFHLFKFKFCDPGNGLCSWMLNVQLKRMHILQFFNTRLWNFSWLMLSSSTFLHFPFYFFYLLLREEYWVFQVLLCLYFQFFQFLFYVFANTVIMCIHV